MSQLPASCNNSYYVKHTASSIFSLATICIEIPLSLFSIYCICKLTPKHLKLQKMLLLAHQFWVTYYSMVMGIGVLPVCFFPYIAFYSRGIFEYLKLDSSLIVYLTGTGYAGMLFSIISLFAYRHRTILPDSHCLKINTRNFKIAVISLHILTFLYAVPLVLTIPDQSVSLVALKNAFSNPPCDLFHPRIIIFWFGMIKQVVGYVTFMAICCNLMVVLVLHSVRVMRYYTSQTSKNTRKRQMGFLYALTLMATIPNVCLLTPTLFFVLCSIRSYSYNAALGDVIVCFVGLHGLLSTLTLIMSHKQYRSELEYWLRLVLFCKKPQPKHVTIHCDKVSTLTSEYNYTLNILDVDLTQNKSIQLRISNNWTDVLNVRYNSTNPPKLDSVVSGVGDDKEIMYYADYDSKKGGYYISYTATIVKTACPKVYYFIVFLLLALIV